MLCINNIELTISWPEEDDKRKASTSEDNFEPDVQQRASGGKGVVFH